MVIFNVLLFFSSVSFLLFGMACLGATYMEREFERYGLAMYRRIVGVLQVAGAVGLLIGILIPVLGLLAAAGLSTLMLLGLMVRIKIKDGFIKSIPALAYMLLNLYLFVALTQQIFVNR